MIEILIYNLKTYGVTTEAETLEYGACLTALIAAILYFTSSPGDSAVSEYTILVASPKLVLIFIPVNLKNLFGLIW